MIKKECIIVNSIHDLNCFINNNNYVFGYAVILDYTESELKKYHNIILCSLDRLKDVIIYINHIVIPNNIHLSDIQNKELLYFLLVNNIEIFDHRIDDFRNSIFEDFIKNKPAYKTLKKPVFLITGLVDNIGKSSFALNLKEQLETHDERVAIVSANELAKLKGMISFPVEEIDKLMMDDKYLFINYYMHRVIDFYKCTVLLICLPGSFCNPNFPDYKRSEALQKLIELSLDIDYHIHLLPINYMDGNIIRNITGYINNKVVKKIDVSIMSNIYLDMSETADSIEDIKHIIVNNPGKELFSGIKNSDNKILSIFDPRLYNIIENDIVHKLGTSEYEFKTL